MTVAEYLDRCDKKTLGCHSNNFFFLQTKGEQETVKPDEAMIFEPEPVQLNNCL